MIEILKLIALEPRLGGVKFWIVETRRFPNFVISCETFATERNLLDKILEPRAARAASGSDKLEIVA